MNLLHKDTPSQSSKHVEAPSFLIMQCPVAVVWPCNFYRCIALCLKNILSILFDTITALEIILHHGKVWRVTKNKYFVQERKSFESSEMTCRNYDILKSIQAHTRC